MPIYPTDWTPTTINPTAWSDDTPDGETRLLEDGTDRLLEDGTDRVLE